MTINLHIYHCWWCGHLMVKFISWLHEIGLSRNLKQNYLCLSLFFLHWVLSSSTWVFDFLLSLAFVCSFFQFHFFFLISSNHHFVHFFFSFHIRIMSGVCCVLVMWGSWAFFITFFSLSINILRFDQLVKKTNFDLKIIFIKTYQRFDILEFSRLVVHQFSGNFTVLNLGFKSCYCWFNIWWQ